MWPQSRVTDGKELAILKSKVAGTAQKWVKTQLPDGTMIRYCDVCVSAVSYPNGLDIISARPTFRAVSVNGSAVQWYRWEPLTWHAVPGQGMCVYVCDSLVSAVSYSGAIPAARDSAATAEIRAWLMSEFYSTAFSDAEMQNIAWISTPTVSMTQGFTASVSDYVALTGANGACYFKTVNPTRPDEPEYKITAFKPLASEKSASASATVGILPILLPPVPYGGGLINWLLRWFH